MALDVADTCGGGGGGEGGPHESTHCAQAAGPAATRSAIVSAVIRQAAAARGRRAPRRRPGEMASISKVKIPSPAAASPAAASRAAIFAFFPARSTFGQLTITSQPRAVVSAQHKRARARGTRGPCFGLISRVLFQHNRILAIPARCASMLISCWRSRIGLPPKAGLSRGSQRSHPRVHKTF